MELKEKIRIKGEITAKFYDQTTLSWFDRIINRFLRKIITSPQTLAKFYRLGKLRTVDYRTNVICNAGFGAITKILTGDTGYTGNGEINKALLGTGSSTPSASDTTLDTEDYRNDMASGTASGNVAFLTAFFSETECSGTYTEFGNVIDGEAGADTGLLWSHIAGLNWVKDTSTVIVVSQKYTFASV